MNPTRALYLLTIANLVLLSWSILGQSPAASAQDHGVLRGRALEIVDAEGRVRASIKVQPSQVFPATGRRYPETVMLRLVDERGRPEVKIGASVEGGELSLVGEADETQVLLSTERGLAAVRLAARGASRTITP